MSRRRLVGLALLLAACGGGLNEPVRIVIPAGASLRATADSLAAHGVIAWAAWFRFRARVGGLDRKLKPGLYRFEPGTSTETALRRIAAGDAEHAMLTLPEGATLFDLARAAEAKLEIPRAKFLAAARDTALLRRRGIAAESVEGWLLPETFDFPALATPREILDRFLTARVERWDPRWTARADSAGLDRGRLLTLASIVEAEAKDPADRPLVAAVYRNRIARGMPLQADPGIQYAYLLRDGSRKPRLYNVDYQFPSPYNTYLHQGLPPGPIGNPSTEAIEAVLAPANVPYLYFVAGADGKHVFARTYQDHLRNIRTIRSAAQ